MKWLFPCWFLLLLMINSGHAQQNWRLEGKSLYELKQEQNQILRITSPSTVSFPIGYQVMHTQGRDKKTPPFYLRTKQLPSAYQYQDLAFFCRLEVKLEHAVRFPVKFRLGEVQYVERMEGKK